MKCFVKYAALGSFVSLLPFAGTLQVKAQPAPIHSPTVAIQKHLPSIAKKPASIVDEELHNAIKDKLSTLKSVKTKHARTERDAVRQFYAERAYKPLWVKDGKIAPDGRALIHTFNNAEALGLSPTEYTLGSISALESLFQSISKQEAAALDVQITRSALLYARHAQAGRVVPSSISSNFDIKRTFPNPTKVLQSLSESKDKAQTLRAYHPQQPEFKVLTAELKKLRTRDTKIERIFISKGKSLRTGMTSDRVAQLRKRLNVPVLGDEQADFFDETLEQAVRAFQAENQLLADGIVGRQTRLTLNEGHANHIPDLIANMERWRWMPRDLNNFHVRVNIPSFTARIMQANTTKHETRVVVGKRSNPTPVFSDEIEHLVVNPYWNVPNSITSKELLPAIQQNPATYLNNRNYEVISRANGRRVDPLAINWSNVDTRQLRIRQRPGRGNALGNIKFMFPNKHAVYLHDTPSKSLFSRVTRAFSHGCVRVKNPFEFADNLLQNDTKWSGERLRRLVGKKESYVNLDRHIPVHITYFTITSNEAGTISYKTDIYGYNERVKRALGLI